MQFGLGLMTLNDYLIKEQETNPNRMKIHWNTIAKVFELHGGIRRHEIRLIEVVI